MAAVLAATLAEVAGGPAAAVAVPDGLNLLAAREHIRNGGFDGGTDHWWRGGQVTNLRVDAGRGCVDVAGNTANPWDALLGQSAISLDEGRSYTLAFDASASAAATIRAQVQLEVAPFPATLSQPVSLDTVSRHFSFPFTSTLGGPQGQVVLQLGGRSAPVTVCLDNVSLLDDGSAVPTAWWQLRDEHSAGEAQYSFGYGQRECTPAIGDWNGDGRTTVGTACPGATDWVWAPRDANSLGPPAVPEFTFGATTCTPVTGDWDGDGKTTIGVACASGGQWAWSLRNGLAAAAPAVPTFSFGPAACRPLTGDWNGDGRTGIGVACGDSSGQWRWELRDQLSAGTPTVTPYLSGSTGCRPIVGDWDGDGSTTTGRACGPGSSWEWYLNNRHTAGDVSYPGYTFGSVARTPVVGDWNGDGATGVGAVSNASAGDTIPPAAPIVSSSTHPDQNAWYTGTSVTASWPVPPDNTGIAGYAVVFDEDPDTAPATVTQTATTVSRAVAEGITHLHVRARDTGGNWSRTTHYPIRVNGAITSAQDGARIQKYLTLQAAGATTFTGATFEFRRSDAEPWSPIPLTGGNVVDAGTGAGVTAWPVPLTGGWTRLLHWNVPVTTGIGGVDGPVHVRAVFAGGSGGHTQSRRAVLDQKAHGAAAENVGPGTVNLVSGNYTVSATDVSIDSFGSDLTFSRTYNSREVNTRLSGPFGAGWVSGLTVEEADQTWVSLREEPGFVLLTESDGAQLSFARPASGSRLVPEPEAADLTLTAVGGGYQLRDLAGNVTTFTKPAGAAEFVPSRVDQPGSAQTTSYGYEVVGGVTRVTRALAPAPSGVDCSAALVAGCRALTFAYATATTATGVDEPAWGDYVGRVRSVSFTGYDPAAGAMATVTVASYLYDSAGRLRASFDPRVTPALKTRYAYDVDGLLATVTPPGERPWTIAYTRVPGDPNIGRLRSVSRPGIPSGTATTTVVYNVPLTGPAAPYQMGAANVAAWGQQDQPIDAAAIFPPDQVPADPPSDYRRATVHYLNRDGREVNQAAPGGHLSTTEYDTKGHGNVIRELTATNRARALASGPGSADRARELDAQRVYSADGLDLLEEWGPHTLLTLADGDVVTARAHTVHTYDENAPEGAAYHLVTTTRVGARTPGAASDVDIRTTTTQYDAQSALGWRLRQPTSTVEDPGGLNLTAVTRYDPATAMVTESRMPANPNGGDARTTLTFYYTAGAHLSVAECGNRPYWANLVCRTQPAAQPGTPGLPDLPVTRTTYNLDNQPVSVVDTVGSFTRTTTTTYDTAGRVTQVTIESPHGTPMPAVRTVYHPDTGAVVRTETTENGATVAVVREYDDLGRLVRYDDADGNLATTEYDLLNRPVRTTDGKGTQVLTYDTQVDPRGLLTSLTDSAAGVFTARYDEDGKIVTAGYPGALEARSTYDEAGAEVRRQYVKIANCTVNCVWLDESVGESVHGQWLSHTSRLSAQLYRYDPAGRLVEVRDTPAESGCTTRTYTYDANSNRLSETRRPSTPDGACDPGSAGTTISHEYDTADRITDPGFAHGTWGRINFVPTLGVGVGYYVNDLVRELNQNGVTTTWTLDPTHRLRTRTQTGGTGAGVRTNHYDADTDNPAWTADNADGTEWTRYIGGIDGDLAATVTHTGAVTLHIANLHGDIVALASPDPNAPAFLETFESTEFGIPRDGQNRRYAWLGEKQRETDGITGIVLMGVRLYVPSLGRFLQVDPVHGGSDNAYEYCAQDPINCTDLDGKAIPLLAIAAGIALRVAARAAIRGCVRYCVRAAKWAGPRVWRAAKGGASKAWRGAKNAWKGAKRAARWAKSTFKRVKNSKAVRIGMRIGTYWRIASGPQNFGGDSRRKGRRPAGAVGWLAKFWGR